MSRKGVLPQHNKINCLARYSVGSRCISCFVCLFTVSAIHLEDGTLETLSVAENSYQPHCRAENQMWFETPLLLRNEQSDRLIDAILP